MTKRFFDRPYRVSTVATPVIAAFLAACGSGGSFVTVPDGGATLDGSSPHSAHDADGADAQHAAKDSGASLDAAPTSDAAPSFDASKTQDAAHAADVGVPTPDGSHPFDAHLTFPDASGPVEVCESCLESTCGADAEKCEADPSCTAAINCAISTGCLAPSDAGVEACVDACIKNEGLTPHEQAVVVQEIGALATCSAPCASSCAMKDGGSS